MIFSVALEKDATQICFGEPANEHPPLNRSELNNFEAESVEPILFSLSSEKGLPIWLLINNQWTQDDAIPVRIFQPLLLELTIRHELNNGNFIMKNGQAVTFELSLMPNFNYSILLSSSSNN